MTVPSTNPERLALDARKPGSLPAAGSWKDALSGLLRDLQRGTGERSGARRDVLAVFFLRASSAAILYLSQIVLARWMGKTEYGIYVSVWTAVLILGGFSSLGLGTLVIRLLPEYREQGRLDLARGLTRNARLVAMLSSTLVGATGGAVLALVPGAVTQPYVLPGFLILICLPMIALSDLHDGIGRGLGRMHLALVPIYVLRPALVLAFMVGAHAIDLPMTAEIAAAAAILATWASGLVQLALMEMRLVRTLGTGEGTATPGPWLGASIPLLGVTLSELALQNADILVLARHLAPGDVAVYFAAAKTISLIMFVHYAVGSAVANRFAALNARGDASALAAFVRDAVHWTFWPSVAIAAALLALGYPLLRLFGPQFTDGYPLMFILAAGFLARAAMGPSEFVLSMLGQHRTCAVNALMTAAATIVLNLTLVPRYGTTGAACATALALAIGALLNTIAASNRLGLDIAVWASFRKTRRPVRLH